LSPGLRPDTDTGCQSNANADSDRDNCGKSDCNACNQPDAYSDSNANINRRCQSNSNTNAYAGP